MTTVDARGLSCPEPLMMTQTAVKKADGPVTVLVDSVVPRDNILKFVKKKKKILAGCPSTETTVLDNRGLLRVVTSDVIYSQCFILQTQKI